MKVEHFDGKNKNKTKQKQKQKKNMGILNPELESILQWAKKVSLRLETGPEFPQNGKNPKLIGTNLFLSEFCIFTILEKFWTGFGAETYFFGHCRLFFNWNCAVSEMEIRLSIYNKKG